MTCIFCKIASGDVATDFLFEDENVVAFRDIRPLTPTHVLIVPREHIASMWELDDPKIGGAILAAATKIAHLEGLEMGFRVISNAGPHGRQEVPHLHFHLVGGAPLGPMLRERD